MNKELSIALYGVDINNEEEVNKKLYSSGIFASPLVNFSHDNSFSSSSISISINPSELFKDSEEPDACVAKQVTIRGPEIGNVKTVKMLPNGEIIVSHGGL